MSISVLIRIEMQYVCACVWACVCVSVCVKGEQVKCAWRGTLYKETVSWNTWMMQYCHCLHSTTIASFGNYRRQGDRPIRYFNNYPDKMKRFYCFCIRISYANVFSSSRVLLSFKSFCCCSHTTLLFFPRGVVSDLDQPCLSTLAGHKGPQGKLFILTSFQENKPRALGASVPRGVQKTQPPRLPGRPAAVSPRAWPQPGVRLPALQAGRCKGKGPLPHSRAVRNVGIVTTPTQRLGLMWHREGAREHVKPMMDPAS